MFVLLPSLQLTIAVDYKKVMQMERLVCRNTIRKLLAKLLEDVKPERLATIARREEFPHPVILSNLLGERLAERYFRALGEMSRELVPKHLGQSELNEALWALFREVAANSASYRLSGRLRNRLYKFTQDVKRPLYPFEVAYSIGNLDLGGEVFSIGTVRFFTMDDNQATLWGLTEDNPAASHACPHWMHHPAAAVEVQAADDRRALETGLAQVTSSMDLLRFAGVIGVISAFSSFDDTLFLWGLNGYSITRQITPNHWERGFRPFITEMGSHIKKGLDPQVSSLQAIANGELPDEISRHLQRAINWISSSITRERLDDKVVDLCTALEVLLLPGNKVRPKAPRIALRHRLIGGAWNPIGISALYDLRSDIVHGSVLNVSQYLDYWHLLVICFSTLDNLVNLAKRNPTVHNLEDLVGIVETQDNLKSVIDLLNTSTIIKGKKAREIKSLARKRLKELEQVV
jgi:hypothetical protein